VHELSRADARRIAVRAQLLDRVRPLGLLEVVRELTMLQNDFTAAVAPNADLVLWSRLGASYAPVELAEALADATLIELRGMIRPAEDIALYRAAMQAWPGEEPGWRQAQYEWVLANEPFRWDILDRQERHGPLTARELPDTCVVPWKSSGWNNNRNIAMMLDLLVLLGEVASTGARRGTDRLWDLAARVYPDAPAVPLAEAVRVRNRRRLRALGIARARTTEAPIEPLDVGEAGEPAVVDGVKGVWRVDPAQLAQPFEGRTALLSPLDRLVYDRKRMVEIFQFDYQLEMYKPVAQRRWGYFALPILHGDRLIGKIDATADRRHGVLRVDAVHEDEPFTPAVRADVHDEIESLARWLGLALQRPR
jgi:uncharacterized protein YcaQ